MRLVEFASAADTLALWKMISDNTWAAIAQQAEAEQRAQAERAAARKSSSKRGSGKSAVKPLPLKRLPPPLQHVTAPVAKDAKSTASAEQAKTEVGKQPTQQQSQLIQAKPTQTIAQPPKLISNQQVANAIPATPRKIQQPIQSVEKK